MDKRCVMLIDCQSFYASVEKVAHPEYKDKPLVVAGDPERRSGIVLAACPLAKKCGVSTADRLWEALKKCPELVVIRPRMQEYIDVSLQISEIFKSYSDLVEPYSIDEHFVEISQVLNMFGSPFEIAKSIQDKVKEETGIYVRAGISENKILAKISCDLIAKKNESGIFYLPKTQLDQHIWSFPVEKMWGVGRKMKQHLNRLGILTIGDLAKTSLPRLIKLWGVNGQVLWQCANGIDNSPVTPNTHDTQKCIGNGMTLPRDYVEAWEIEVVLQDLVSQVTRRMREKKVMGIVISVSCSGADWDFPTGFNRQMKMEDPTDATSIIFKQVKKIFHANWDKEPVRRLGVAVSGLSSSEVYQLSMFDNSVTERKIDSVMDLIKNKYGETAILRASSITSAGQAMDRAAKIGGHYK
ncbi:DNA polymerase IV [Paenibacillus sp. N1-5-1-14]|uniref:DNA polymerase IV n=1 Tax=Paenibacillus radicibacter TaxID=2972488 RepID=UPI0021590A18|nr:DNA polymerase IV [Paenibacillus radicibacter]MCR8641418.1 DNA polymerase IV [Paenibacillus radicibacter]